MVHFGTSMLVENLPESVQTRVSQVTRFDIRFRAFTTGANPGFCLSLNGAIDIAYLILLQMTIC
jgi:hypothetical protein